MRSESAAKSRERVAAGALPSSVRFADSFPKGGSLYQRPCRSAASTVFSMSMARVMGVLGLNVVAEVPFIMPCS